MANTTVVSWNVNGLRAVLKKGFADWLQESKPDVLCLQESRVLPSDLTEAELSPKGYTSVFTPAQKKGYSGVATFSRTEPLSVSTLGKKEFDDEGRAQAIEFKNYTVVNCYFPNSQAERKRLEYKLRFVTAIKRYCDKLVKDGKNVILCGDYNIAHTEIDLARPKPNQDNPGYYIEEREAMTKFLKGGYVDTFRHFNPDPGHYTWWSYRAGARGNNVGWRIDYHCVNKDFIDRVKKSVIYSDVMGSDHCPLAVTIKD
jgi:exodeoxyribonuclease-3